MSAIQLAAIWGSVTEVDEYDTFDVGAALEAASRLVHTDSAGYLDARMAEVYNNPGGIFDDKIDYF